MNGAVSSRGFPRIFNLTQGSGSPDFRAFCDTLGRTNGALLGLDIGTRHVGMAVSDEGRRVAFKALSYRRGTLNEDRRVVHGQLETMEAAVVIVGMPGPHASANPQRYEDLRRFVATYSALLLRDSSCGVCGFWDERYSTVIATEKVREAAKRAARRDVRARKRMVDEGAAAEILQEVLTAMTIADSLRLEEA